MDIDRDYGTFVDTIYSMGLQDCIDCYQAALPRYNARSETASFHPFIRSSGKHTAFRGCYFIFRFLTFHVQGRLHCPKVLC